MKYIVKNGTNDNVLVLLHGTGGDAYNLLELADYLDPAATKIGTEGDIVEDGMRRYFERNPDGSFVEESLMRETTVLYETIAEALEESDLTEKNVILVGYSNGSNIALNILKEYETNYRVALLFHPSSVRPGVPFKKQHKLKLLITSGENDPFISIDQYRELSDELKESGIDFESLVHGHGHSLIHEELEAGKNLIVRLNEEK